MYILDIQEKHARVYISFVVSVQWAVDHAAVMQLAYYQ
jgi:hypothetical protein